ncbi:hypothetical protein HZQ19_09600 [Elizabethkingia anophelis]|uniref:hypothetical protein n=2 Tax=Elizabethkingia anophelis TaxID=1117645 RepID=UPI0021A67EAA|nr:hypothetical protein [Elizabethkingia anophelis]MCT3973358.1 hypothetical protein [Elizabethkingia anophelis]MCT4002123.1 hypothetical protein [Elizabethkingia anophelis]MCT4016314.1 hypothetical protein [Elizabethkingia anophelis]MCT4019704.1 hypothetical protein [Elizabethkingia anophelis]
MDKITIYETITNFLLNNWFISIFVLLVICTSAIPPLRDGVIQIKDWFFKKKEFKIQRKDELITFEYKKKTTHFDIVKVNASTHELGINAEYLWINKYYPKHKIKVQASKTIKVNNEKLFYDVFTIELNNKTKSIYFDTSEFFNENGSSLIDLNKFVVSKIKELHNK